MLKQVLPIGTIVLLKDAEKRLMVVGYQQKKNHEATQVYDYIGCVYPEGYVGPKEMILFNHDDIEYTFALGFQNEEQTAFRKHLEAELDRMNLRK